MSNKEENPNDFVDIICTTRFEQPQDYIGLVRKASAKLKSLTDSNVLLLYEACQDIAQRLEQIPHRGRDMAILYGAMGTLLVRRTDAFVDEELHSIKTAEAIYQKGLEYDIGQSQKGYLQQKLGHAHWTHATLVGDYSTKSQLKFYKKARQKFYDAAKNCGGKKNVAQLRYNLARQVSYVAHQVVLDDIVKDALWVANIAAAQTDSHIICGRFIADQDTNGLQAACKDAYQGLDLAARLRKGPKTTEYPALIQNTQKLVTEISKDDDNDEIRSLRARAATLRAA